MDFWNQRNVLVTGCTGFLGWHLTAELIEKKANVTGLIRDYNANSPFFTSGIDRSISIVNGDLADYSTLERAINEYEIDTVFHLAAQAIVGVANKNPISTFEANIKGTWNILEACRNTDRVSRIVVASSDKAYGSQKKLPYTEECPLQGEHPYDVSKSCADLISMAYHTTFNLPVCITRCGNLFGPGDYNFNRIVPGTIRSILNGQAPVIRSDGSPVRDYIHVKDAVDAYLFLAEKMDTPGIHGQAFNFGTNEPLSVLELTEMILATAGRQDLKPEIQATSSGEISKQYLSSKKAQDVLGWRPRALIQERLEETLDWYKANSK